jgi:hypothetical protein
MRAVNDPVLWNELARRDGAAQVMGTLARKTGGVRFRSHGSPLWHDLASEEEEVAVGDTVFTGDDGHAVLRLKDGGVAEIQPGSLIVVGRAEEGQGEEDWLKNAFGSLVRGPSVESMLRVEKGTAKVSLRKGAAPVKLDIQGKVYQLSSRTGGGTAEVSVDSPVRKGEPAARFVSGSNGKIEVQEGTKEGARKIEFGAGEAAVVGTNTRPRSASMLSGAHAFMAPVSCSWPGGTGSNAHFCSPVRMS